MRKIITLICLTSVLGCKSIILKIITPKNVKKSLKVMTREDQTIVFLPTVHLAKKDFYIQCRKIIDSLKKEKYTVFYESIDINKKYLKQPRDPVDEKNISILARKFRKLIGMNILTGYTDPANKSLPQYYRNSKYINQTNELLGIDSLDIHADISLTKLIAAHEEKYGEIALTPCDNNTALHEKYKCDEVADHYYAVRYLRDSIAAHKVLKYNHKKSLIIYGKAHWWGIWPYLRDTGYTLNKP